MRNQPIFTFAFVIFTFCVSAIVVNGQFPIKIPGIPKVEKPKPSGSEKSSDKPSSSSSSSSSAVAQTRGKRIYENDYPNSTPVVIQPRVFIQAVNSNSYWKMPNASNVTSWIPEIKVDLFWDENARLETIAEFYNPDGSLWFTESLQTAGKMLRSNETWNLIDSKSTNSTGVYSVKVKNKATGNVIFAGKFKVNKFLASFNAADRNKLGFYVDHDWLVPLGIIYIPTSQDLSKTIQHPVFSVWTKGDVKYEEMEAQLHFNGKMIASKKVNSGAAEDERISKFTVPFDMGSIYKRWDLQFENVLLENGNPYNPEYFTNAHFVDKNPGQYTFKLFRNGTQIREFSASIGPDGRWTEPPYNAVFKFPHNGVLLPAKVMGNQEKYNALSWKTDMFYGNPIAGFSIQ